MQGVGKIGRARVAAKGGKGKKEGKREKRKNAVQNNGRWKIKGREREKLQEGMIYKNTRNEKKGGRGG